MSEAPKSINTQLYDAVAELAQEGDNLERARANLSRARAEECTALNRVNEAQKKFDALVATVKNEAPNGSDWKSFLNRAVARTDRFDSTSG